MNNRNQPKIFLRKLRSQSLIFRDKIFNPKRILKIILPVVLGVFFTLFVAVITVAISYNNKLVSEIYKLNPEFNTAVILVADNAQTLNLLDNGKELLDKKIITRLYFIRIGENVAPLASKPDYIEKELFYNSALEFCTHIQSDALIHKFITIGSKPNLITTSFICNSKGIYTEGFMPDNESKDRLNYFELAVDIINLIFNP